MTIIAPLTLASLVLMHLQQKIFFVSKLLHAVQVSFFRSTWDESISSEEPVRFGSRLDKEGRCTHMEDVVGAAEIDAWRVIFSLFDLLRFRINLGLLFALYLRANHFGLCSAKPIVFGRVCFRLCLLELCLLHHIRSVRKADGRALIFLDSVVELGYSDVVNVDSHPELC